MLTRTTYFLKRKKEVSVCNRSITFNGPPNLSISHLYGPSREKDVDCFHVKLTLTLLQLTFRSFALTESILFCFFSTVSGAISRFSFGLVQANWIQRLNGWCCMRLTPIIHMFHNVLDRYKSKSFWAFCLWDSPFQRPGIYIRLSSVIQMTLFVIAIYERRIFITQFLIILLHRIRLYLLRFSDTNKAREEKDLLLLVSLINNKLEWRLKNLHLQKMLERGMIQASSASLAAIWLPWLLNQ